MDVSSRGALEERVTVASGNDPHVVWQRLIGVAYDSDRYDMLSEWRKARLEVQIKGVHCRSPPVRPGTPSGLHGTH